MGSSTQRLKSDQSQPQKPNTQLNMPHQLKAEEVQQEAPVVEATPAADCDDLAKAKEACLAGGGGLGLLLLEVATGANIPCRYLHLAVPPVQIFILTLMYLLVPAFAIYMQTISNKYYSLI